MERVKNDRLWKGWRVGGEWRVTPSLREVEALGNNIKGNRLLVREVKNLPGHTRIAFIYLL